MTENWSMTPEEMKSILKERAARVENFFRRSIDYGDTPARLKEAMFYSLQAGGKRIRPALCMSCAALFGLPEERSLPFAAAIEMIHTYSLIHDDLPAMDNDDLRRGRPSNHKAFDEATAILAGDGLLTDAFAVIAVMDISAEILLAALLELARAAGSAGMVGGQMEDMLYTGQNGISLEQLRHMQAMKTGAILRASCVCGAMLGGADKERLEKIGRFGFALGRAFQMADDILDVTGTTKELGKPAGSDEESGKNTYPALVGLEESRRLAREEARQAAGALDGFAGREAAFLRTLAEYVIKRAA